MKTPLLILIFAALGIAPALADTPTGTVFEIAPTRNLFPDAARQRGLTEGWARVAVSIDTDGRLLDHLVVAASDTTFADEASRLIRTARISPPREQGRPIAIRTEVNIVFRNSGLFVISDFQAISELYLHGRFERARPVHLTTMRELDRPPRPQSAPAPFYADELAQRGIAGRVVVDFFIDQQGRVRLPSIQASDHPELADLALAAVSQWSFEPPTQSGAPALVRAQQTFEFTPAT